MTCCSPSVGDMNWFGLLQMVWSSPSGLVFSKWFGLLQGLVDSTGSVWAKGTTHTRAKGGGGGEGGGRRNKVPETLKGTNPKARNESHLAVNNGLGNFHNDGIAHSAHIQHCVLSQPLQELILHLHIDKTLSVNQLIFVNASNEANNAEIGTM